MYNLLYYKQITHQVRDPCNSDSPTLLQVIQPSLQLNYLVGGIFFIKIFQLHK